MERWHIDLALWTKCLISAVFKLKSDILHIGRMILLLLRTTAGLQILLEKPVSRSWQSHQDGGFK